MATTATVAALRITTVDIAGDVEVLTVPNYAWIDGGSDDDVVECPLAWDLCDFADPSIYVSVRVEPIITTETV